VVTLSVLRVRNENLHSWSVGSLVAFLIVTAICVGLVLFLGAQSLPRADDFCRASAAPLTAFPSKVNAQVTDYGVWSYYNWSGRWAGIAFETFLLSSTPQPKSYPLLLLLMIAAQVFLLYIACMQFLLDTRSAICFIALFALVYWANLPSVQEGMFWITGTIENQLSVMLVLLLFALLLSPRANKDESSNWRTIIACILALVVPAIHELLGGMLVLILFAVTVRMVLLKTSNLKLWATVWSASIIGFLIVFLAPGNAIRQGFYPNRGNVSTTVKLSLDTIRLYILPWCLDFKHWLLAVFLWLDPRTRSLRRRLPELVSLRSIGVFCFAWSSLLIVAVVMVIWETGEGIRPRTMNLLYGVFLAGWIVLVFLLTRPSLSISINRTLRTELRSVTLILLSALIVTSNNTLLGLADILHGRTRSWNAQLNRRFDLLRSINRGSDVYVEQLSTHPLSYIGWDDVTDSPDNWSNQCVSRYFDAHSVRVPNTPSGGR
jgi:hypothetical protein